MSESNPHAVATVGERVDFDVVPEEVREILIAFAQQGENGQVILNLNNGSVESYKVVRYLRVVDRERANGSKSKDDGGRPDETSPKPITV